MVSFWSKIGQYLGAWIPTGPEPHRGFISVSKHLREVADALPVDSTLRQALRTELHGDGIHYFWMDEMKRGGVKCGKVRNSPYVVLRPRFLKIARIMYFTCYDDPDSHGYEPRANQILPNEWP